LRPIYDSSPVWLVPIAIVACAATGLGIYLSTRRDMGDSIIRESEQSAPHYTLVRGPFRLGLRLTRGIIIGWTIGTCFLFGFLAMIAKTVDQAIKESPQLGNTLQQVSGQDGFSHIFIGMSFLFGALLIMGFVTNMVSVLRAEESKGRLDNLLVRKLGRAQWLIGRIALTTLAATFIALLAGTVSYLVARTQGIDLPAVDTIIGGLNILGAVLLLFGIGLALFALVPRAAILALYGLMGWAFLSQIVSSVITWHPLQNIVNNTSLLKPVYLVPAQQPDWTQIGVLLYVAMLLGIFAIIGFNRRDISTE
jgi:ABC-2 type transport system permease protein